MRRTSFVARLILAGVFVGAGLAKLVANAELVEELAGLLRLQGWAEDRAASWAAWATPVLGGIEVLAGLSLLMRATRPAGSLAIMLLLAGGTLFYGLATGWGETTGVPCACGIPAPGTDGTNSMAALLLRQSVLFVGLALGSWKQPASPARPPKDGRARDGGFRAAPVPPGLAARPDRNGD